MKDTIDFLQKLSQHNPDLILLFDIRHKSFSFISESAQQFFHLNKEDLQRNSHELQSFVHPEDEEYVLGHLQKLVESESFVNIEFRLLMPDRSVKWIYLKAQFMEEGQVVGFLEDISKRKEYERSLYNIKEQKDTVLQILGHDLRAPLHTIQMSTNLLDSEIKKHEDKGIQQLVDVISRTCRNALGLISNVLDIEFLQTQSVQLKKERIDLVSRIRNQIETYQLRDKQKNFEVRTNAPTVHAEVDVVKFMLVIENILSNAYKFTEPDGHITISVEEKEKTVLITIADDGIGIPDKLKPIVFDKFTKARRPGAQGERPVGLGMHLVKKMVELHKGKIRFESEEGKGTTFYVDLPK